MGIRISNDDALSRLEAAVTLAMSSVTLPQGWADFGETVYAMSSKTYATALVTSLLAKATDAQVDPLSIKKAYSSRAFSLRTLGHAVVVPQARKLGFSIRSTGREPLNNQPFFRYDHMKEISRVLHQEQHDAFVAGLEKADQLDANQALLALAAVLRTGIDYQAALQQGVGDLSEATDLPRLLQRLRHFARPDAPDRPRRLQAIGAAALDLGHSNVRSRRINDPSRDLPGDVQAYGEEGLPYVAMEVRGKRVPMTELEAFVDACASAGIGRVMLYVDTPAHRSLLEPGVQHSAVSQEELLLTVFESTEALALEAMAWADSPLYESVDKFNRAVDHRLREIEASLDTLADWASDGLLQT